MRQMEPGVLNHHAEGGLVGKLPGSYQKKFMWIKKYNFCCLKSIKIGANCYHSIAKPVLIDTQESDGECSSVRMAKEEFSDKATVTIVIVIWRWSWVREG